MPALLYPTFLQPWWTAAHQAPLSMRFPRQEYQSGLPFPAPRDLPNLGIKPASPALSEVKWKSLTHVWLFATPWTTQSMDFSRPDTGVGSLSLLPGIFPTQELNPGLPHCRQILHQLSHKGSPRILEWVAYPFSRGSSWPRNWTGVSCIAGRFFTNWVIMEAPSISWSLSNIHPTFMNENNY